MSQIAHALAKAKERTGHTTAPFLVSGSVAPVLGTDREAALRRARHRQRFWIILAVVTLPLTAFICWTQFKSAFASPLAAEPVPVSTPSASSEAPKAAAVASGAASGSARTGSAAASTGQGTQRTELLQLVNDLAISAVMPGDPARIMLAGRVVRAGQPVDGGLVFSGIADGVLRFTDANGVLYTRHY